MEEKECKKIVFFGLVQGVGFRWFIKKNAQKLGLKGHVRNLDDKSVEIIVLGKDFDIDSLFAICMKGNGFSKISDYNIEKWNCKDIKDSFKIL